MLRTLATVAAFAAPMHGHHKPAVKHVRGCNTHSCDVRIARWLERWRKRHEPPMRATIASYYDDSGPTACSDGHGGTLHATYGFAHLGPGETTEYEPMLCGTRVRICAVRCVVATMDDHGPYVAGREYDLDEATKDATGASDLGTIRVAVQR